MATIATRTTMPRKTQSPTDIERPSSNRKQVPACYEVPMALANAAQFDLLDLQRLLGRGSVFDRARAAILELPFEAPVQRVRSAAAERDREHHEAPPQRVLRGVIAMRPEYAEGDDGELDGGGRREKSREQPQGDANAAEKLEEGQNQIVNRIKLRPQGSSRALLCQSGKDRRQAHELLRAVDREIDAGHDADDEPRKRNRPFVEAFEKGQKQLGSFHHLGHESRSPLFGSSSGVESTRSGSVPSPHAKLRPPRNQNV